MNHRMFAALCLLLVSACGGGIAHTKVSKPAQSEVTAQALGKVGRITSMRESGGTLFVGAERGLAAVDAGGKVLWTLELPAAMARLVEADEAGVAFTSFNGDGIDEGGGVSHFLLGDLGDTPKFKDQMVGTASREGKLRFNVPAQTGISQMSPPGLSKESIGVSRGRGFFAYSRADGHELGKTVLYGDGTLEDAFVLNGSFNRPAFLNGSWYVAHLSTFVKTDGAGKEQDRTGLWSLFLALENLTIGPIVVKERLLVGSSPSSNKLPHVFAFDKDGGKDWREKIEDTSSGVGAFAVNSKLVFAATNFYVVAMNEKGSTQWTAVNSKGGLYPGKYRGLRFSQNYGARRSQGSLIAADEKNVYVSSTIDEHDVLTVLNANTGEYVGSLALDTFVSDMVVVGDKLALSTDDGLRFISLL